MKLCYKIKLTIIDTQSYFVHLEEYAIYVHIYVCTYVHTHTHLIHIYMYMFMHANARMRTNTHTHIHTHHTTHIYILTPRLYTTTDS
jgi:hypothetical protein